ncbi:hypothetical protein [Phenylobacterium sp.]|uniref:hypothetical protein n=1 Tax=Phenylobacterium sp. TaxID=1871053 RepID=UPI002B931EC2|nr:hypothetical protein [Phenylobacterium sp.]HLZ75619.1 hypothetical protein [Phenylobacterium sp.]
MVHESRSPVVARGGEVTVYGAAAPRLSRRAAKPALVCATAALCLFTSGCATFKGASPVVNNQGPVVPREDGRTTPYPDDPVLQAFRDAYEASRLASAAAAKVPKTSAADITPPPPPTKSNDASTGDAPPPQPPTDENLKALAMVAAAVPLITQNCDNYFASNGEEETYLLFGKDALTVGSGLGSAVLSASRATARTVSAAAIGFSTVTASTDIYHKHLTFGATFAWSAQKMVRTNIQALWDGVRNKDITDYTFGFAVQDIRDIQAKCTPYVIISDMTDAIANNAVTAAPATPPISDKFDTGNKTDNTGGGAPTPAAGATPGGAAPGGAPAPKTPPTPTADDTKKAKTLQSKAKSLQTQLQAFVDKGLVADPGLAFKNLDEVAKGQTPTAPPPPPQAPTAPSQPPGQAPAKQPQPRPAAKFPAQTRLKLVPAN